MAENMKSNSDNWIVFLNGEPFRGKLELEDIKFEDEENMLEDFEPYDIIFQPERKTTIVIWEDGSKTIVKCHDDEFSKEFGFAMALAKKIYGRGRFLQLVENASVQHTTEKKKKESSKQESFTPAPPTTASYVLHSRQPDNEYKSELCNQSKKHMTVQEACRKCFEVAEAADDIYDTLSKIGEGNFVPDRNSNYSA